MFLHSLTKGHCSPGTLLQPSCFLTVSFLWETSLTWMHFAATCAVMNVAHPSVERQTQGPNCEMGIFIWTSNRQFKLRLFESYCLPVWSSSCTPRPDEGHLCPLVYLRQKSSRNCHGFLPLFFSPPHCLSGTAIRFVLSVTAATALFFLQG